VRIDTPRLQALRRRLRKLAGMPPQTVGLALGVFDFCHHGHVNLLTRAAAACDRLVVGVHTDESVLAYKGVRPANSALERRRAIDALGLADVVEVESDRVALCRRHGVTHVFHGDDWTHDSYAAHWGETLLAELGVELVMLPHTPGVTSTALREQVPRLGWWLYSRLPGWSRAHIFDHIKMLHAEVGGSWFISEAGRDLVREHFPNSPRVLIGDRQDQSAAVREVLRQDIDVLVTAHFNYGAMLPELSRRDRPLHLVVLSHGRSGKAGTSADVHHAMRSRAGNGSSRGGLVVKHGAVTVHDWSYAEDSYLHFDAFLADGGSFTNPPPATDRPVLLVLPTWGPDVEGRSLLLSRAWTDDFRRLSRDWDVRISPHPLSRPGAAARLAKATGGRVMPAAGDSYRLVPEAHAVVCDLSGVFWESLLFDTPVLLAAAGGAPAWTAGLRPTPEEVAEVVPVVRPGDLFGALTDLAGCRRPEQRPLAEARLGHIDGGATTRLAAALRELLVEGGSGGG